MNQLLSKIESKEAVVSIIGLGYVGLPLATAVEADLLPVAGPQMTVQAPSADGLRLKAEFEAERFARWFGG